MERQVVGPPKRLLSLNEAAEMCGLSIHTLRAWVHQGKVPIVRIDTTLRIDRNDLEAVIQSAKQPWKPQQSLAVNARKGHQRRKQQQKARHAA